MGKKRSRDAVAADLIGRIYDASLDSTQWANLAPAVADALNSSSAGIILNSAHSGPHWLSHTPNIDSAAKQTHFDYYHKVDVWAQRAARIEKSRIFVSPELIADQEFAETEIYRDWLRRLDVFRVLGSVFDVAEDEFVILGIHRSRHAEAFAENDKKQLGLIFPHLKRALQLRHRLAGRTIEGEASLAALDRTGIAVLIVDRKSHVLHANGAALEILRRGDALKATFDRLACLSSGRTSELDALIQGAIDTARGKVTKNGGALRLPRPGRLPVTLFVAPFRPPRGTLASFEPAALLLVRDPELSTADNRLLREVFGFTPTEAAVAALLAEGKSIEEVARAQSVSINTVRTHLKNLLIKTDTNRQAELVSTILQSVAVLKKPQI